jgi:hypothetical protein
MATDYPTRGNQVVESSDPKRYFTRTGIPSEVPDAIAEGNRRRE